MKKLLSLILTTSLLSSALFTACTSAEQASETNSVSLSAEDETEILKAEAKETAKLYSVKALPTAYASYLAQNMQANTSTDLQAEQAEVLKSEISGVSEKYKAEIEKIGLSEEDKALEEKYSAYIDAFTDMAFNFYNSVTAESGSEERESFPDNITADGSRANKEFEDTLDALVSAHTENDAVSKYNSGFSSDEGSASYKYYAELNGIISPALEKTENVKFEDYTPELLEALSDEIRSSVEAVEAPEEQMFLKYLMLEACDLISESEELIGEKGLETDPEGEGYENYITLFRKAGTAFYIFHTVTSNFE